MATELGCFLWAWGSAGGGKAEHQVLVQHQVLV